MATLTEMEVTQLRNIRKAPGETPEELAKSIKRLAAAVLKMAGGKPPPRAPSKDEPETRGWYATQDAARRRRP